MKDWIDIKPERGENESFEEYKIRQLLIKKALKIQPGSGKTQQEILNLLNRVLERRNEPK